MDFRHWFMMDELLSCNDITAGEWALNCFQCINSSSFTREQITTLVTSLPEVSSWFYHHCISLVFSIVLEIWSQAADWKSTDIFWTVYFHLFASTYINTSTIFWTSPAILASRALGRLPLPTVVAGETLIRWVVWGDIGHPGLGRRADVVQLPNVGVSVEQVRTALGALEFVKGIVESGLWKKRKLQFEEIAKWCL